jgi:hypothetical protein
MSLCLALGATAACGDDSDNPPLGPDAKVFLDAPPIDIDAPLPECDVDCAEGGEVRLEYLEFPTGNATADRTRATAFFFGGASSYHTFPSIPGCTDMTPTAPTKWPLAQDAGRTYLDVGNVIISGGPTPIQVTKRVMGQGTGTTGTGDDYIASDFLDRQYAGGTWYFTGNSGSQALNTGQGGLNNVGRLYVTDDTKYDVTITGGAAFPPTIFKDVLYMPNRYPLISPAQHASTDQPLQLTAGALTITYTVPTNTNLPAGSEVDTLVAFTKVNPPVILCIEEGIDGSITIPANMVDTVRTATGGGGAGDTSGNNRFLRQHVVHNTRTMPDTANRKRIDFLSVWCYNYPFHTPP